MFNIGDIVTGIGNNHYAYTTENALMYVTAVSDNAESMAVTIIAHTSRSEVGDNYSVSQCRFVSITPEAFFEKYPDAYKCGDYENYIATSNIKGGKLMSDIMSSFIKVNSYSYSEEQKEMFFSISYELFNDPKHLMDGYDYNPTDTGLTAIWETIKRNKGITAILSHHPKWDDKNMYIHLTENYHRGIDRDGINDFVRYLYTRLGKCAESVEVKYQNMNYATIEVWKKSAYRTVSRLIDLGDEDIVYKGRGLKYYQDQYVEARRALDAIENISEEFYNNGTCYRVPNKDYYKFNAISRVIDLICGNDNNIVTEDFAKIINKCAEHIAPLDSKGNTVKFNATEGQKVSRCVNKFFTWAGDTFVKHVDMQTETWTTDNGEHHSRTKDKGWNNQFAHYSDSINPLDVKRHTYISVNPLDWWTMSFGNGWASCHTVDKENRRRVDGNHYSGCYSSGTESYMLDPYSFIMYTVRENFNGEKSWFEDKINRCVFFLGEDKLIQERVYPDGRDGGSETIASEMRAIAQTVVAECLGVSNMWTLRKGTSACREVVDSIGTHYRDYAHYSDCNVSYLKTPDTLPNTKKIIVGHNPICPCCGEEHREEQWITCDSCRDEGHYVYCHECGDRIDLDRDDYVYDEDTGNYYCDSECAENYNVYWCDNVDAYHSEHVYWDDYREEYYYDYHDNCITTVNGNTYRDAETAELAGYRETDDGEWYHEDEVRYCEYCDRYVHESEWNEELECCVGCEDAVRAERATEGVA